MLLGGNEEGDSGDQNQENEDGSQMPAPPEKPLLSAAEWIKAFRGRGKQSSETDNNLN